MSKLILDNTFTNFDNTKLNPIFEEVILKKYKYNPDFVDPYNVIKFISTNKSNFEMNFPNNRYMEAFCLSLIEYFKKIEEYKNCAIIKNYLDQYLEELPKTKEEALSSILEAAERFIQTTLNEQEDQIEKNAEVISLNLYASVGRLFIFGWGLWNEKSELTQEYIADGIFHPQLMAMDLIKSATEKIIEKYSKLDD